MKFTVTMKDPDTLGEAIREAVMRDLDKVAGLSKGERMTLSSDRCDHVSDIAGTWFKFGEYLTIEIDTEAKTATVLPAQ